VNGRIKRGHQTTFSWTIYEEIINQSKLKFIAINPHFSDYPPSCGIQEEILNIITIVYQADFPITQCFIRYCATR
jgi:hypothetical protein